MYSCHGDAKKEHSDIIVQNKTLLYGNRFYMNGNKLASEDQMPKICLLYTLVFSHNVPSPEKIVFRGVHVVSGYRDITLSERSFIFCGI